MSNYIILHVLTFVLHVQLHNHYTCYYMLITGCFTNAITCILHGFTCFRVDYMGFFILIYMHDYIFHYIQVYIILHDRLHVFYKTLSAREPLSLSARPLPADSGPGSNECDGSRVAGWAQRGRSRAHWIIIPEEPHKN
jgi:hypothetical protein